MHSGLTLEEHGAVALVRMRFGKANSMTAEVLEALDAAFVSLSAGPARAIVLTGDGRAFSAGLSLPSLFGLERPVLTGFMALFERAMRRVFTCPKPVIAAVDGHAIAGGCVLALQADRRLATDRAVKIGLNEVAIGLGLPASVQEPVRLQVPAASWFPVALEGRLFDPAGARAAGLMDEVVRAEALEARALEVASGCARLAPPAYAQVKLGMRAGAIEAWDRRGPAERERWLDAWYTDETQETLRRTVAALAAKG